MRPWPVRPVLAEAWLRESSGSSCSSEALREEERLGRDEGMPSLSEAPRSVRLELASEASSSESRAAGASPAYGDGMVCVRVCGCREDGRQECS